jgi:cysteine-rich repeat protein
MRLGRAFWLSLAVLGGAGAAVAAACGGSDGVGAEGVCGNGIVEGAEDCDDGNSDDSDACVSGCRNARCGDGVQSLGEECDDGNVANGDCCSNDCRRNAGQSCLETCGNGAIDAGEDCDDGGETASCDSDCTAVECGDGIINEVAGEDCEPSELGDCPATCRNNPTGAGGDPCKGVETFAGVVTDNLNPTGVGPGIASVWSYGGQLGVAAGNAMCQAIGADHVCTYEEVLEAAQKGELSSLAAGSTYWLHRVAGDVPRLGGGVGMSPPGPGGRCNDWTYPTNHIADGEYAVIAGAGGDECVDHNGSGGCPATNGVCFCTDNDTAYTGVASDGHAAADGPGAAGSCGPPESVERGIMCCFPVCN